MAKGYTLREAQRIVNHYNQVTKSNVTLSPYRPGEALDDLMAKLFEDLDRMDDQKRVKSYKLIRFDSSGTEQPDTRTEVAIAGHRDALVEYAEVVLKAKVGREHRKNGLASYYDIEEGIAPILTLSEPPPNRDRF